MKKNTNKKGFTIVELVVVIAVIAILSAVLIPTFSSIVKKSKVASDTTLTKHLNTALATYDVVNDVDDFSDVLAATREAGFILGNLNPTTEGHYFVWEKDSNQILLVDGNDNFKIVYKSKDVKDEYSTIAGGTWYIAAKDASALAGVAGVNSIPAMTASKVNGDGQKVEDTLSAGGMVILSESLALNTAPVNGSNPDPIRINSGIDTEWDLNGQTITATFTTADHRTVHVADTTFELSNGTIVASGEAKTGGLWGIMRIDRSNVTISNMTFQYTNTLTTSAKAGAIIKIAEGGDEVVTIKDSTFIAGHTMGVEVGNDAYFENVTIKSSGENGWADAAIAASYGATATIASGYYEAQGHVLHVCNSGGTIKVKGGTFVGDIKLDADAGKVAKLEISGGTFVIGGTTYTFADLLAMEDTDLKVLVAYSGSAMTVNNNGSVITYTVVNE